MPRGMTKKPAKKIAAAAKKPAAPAAPTPPWGELRKQIAEEDAKNNAQAMQKKKHGGQTKRTPEIEQEVLHGLRMGIPLTTICDKLDIHDDTVRLWRNKDDDFDQAIARAREYGEDRIAASCLSELEREAEYAIGPKGGRSVDSGEVALRRVRIDGRLKLLAKWNPKRWGEKIQQEVSGPDGKPIPVATSIDLRGLNPAELVQMEALLAKVQGAKV